MRKLTIISVAMALAAASEHRPFGSGGGNDFDADHWLRHNRERIDARKVRKQMLPKKQKRQIFKVTYSKGKPPKFSY